MNGLLHQVSSSLRLYLRNRMGMIYGYIFPSIFLAAFGVLYRFDRPPLIRHMGELLTVTVLGGACFGLPTTLVGERERGVWRRYKLTPMPTRVLVTGAVLARFVILISAGVLQVALAMLLGMPFPRHPLALAAAFTFVSFAFLGLGLVIAMMADNVPAVQALGQCVFLPMLIIGGVAVPLGSLPAWAQHVSAFFPGRYAVDAIQATVTNTGLAPARFDLLALALIGAACLIVGGRLFRWDSAQRFSSTGGAGWVAVALVSWVAVGVLAEARGHVAIPVMTTAVASSPSYTTAPSAVSPSPAVPAVTPSPAVPAPASSAPAAVAPASPDARTSSGSRAPAPSNGTAPAAKTPATKTVSAAAPPVAPRQSPSRPAEPPVSSAASASTPAPLCAPNAAGNASGDNGLPTYAPGSWRDVTFTRVNGALCGTWGTAWNAQQPIYFDGLPPDSGVVSPIATAADLPDQDTADQLAYITDALAAWPPAKAADPVQRARNELYVAAAADSLQVPLEPFLPAVVFTQLQHDLSKEDLEKILFWIATHAYDGDDSAVLQIRALGFQSVPSDLGQVRDRTGLYAVKLLGRLTGNIVQK